MFESTEAPELIDVMGSALRRESAAVAERLAAVAALLRRRRQEYVEAELWLTDVVEAVAAEVSAAQNISRSRARSQVQMAEHLHQRLPRVAELFARGDIDLRMVHTVINRTDNVEDDVIAVVDDALAQRVSKWMRLSTRKLRDRLDLWVAKFDPAAVRVPPVAKDNRYFDIEPHIPGLAFAGGVLNALDAAALDQLVIEIAGTVCADDPRTISQRRSDACGAIGRRESTLKCQCGSPACPAVQTREKATQLAIHVLAEQATLDGTSDNPGYLSGFGILPAEEVREAAKSKAAVFKPVCLPGADREAGYRPSARLKDYLQWRDLTCRFPGCDAPVARCDVDHTKPWPFGVTHASGCKHYCRTHHLIKTFYTGENGWSDEQRSDGTIELRAPTGHVYTTEAHGGQLFPALAVPTAPLPEVEVPEQSANRSAMMPRRIRTREQDRRDRISRERRQRVEIDAEQERQHQAWLAATYEPPPF